MYIYIYIYVFACVCIYTYIYTSSGAVSFGAGCDGAFSGSLCEAGSSTFRQRTNVCMPTPSSHGKNSAAEICSKGWAAQKPFVDR